MVKGTLKLITLLQTLLLLVLGTMRSSYLPAGNSAVKGGGGPEVGGRCALLLMYGGPVVQFQFPISNIQNR